MSNIRYCGEQLAQLSGSSSILPPTNKGWAQRQLGGDWEQLGGRGCQGTGVCPPVPYGNKGPRVTNSNEEVPFPILYKLSNRPTSHGQAQAV